MIVAGVMSGTSADGVDVALARVAGRGFSLRFELLGHLHSAYPQTVRQAVLQTMNAGQAGVADLSRLNFLLGELYAEAVRKAQQRFRIRPDLVGCHGQTIYHQGAATAFLGKRIACTWQLGEGAVIAKRLGIPVVSDFRPADMAAGGKGAPLVPYLDYVVFRDRRVGRIVQNIGGIANLTAIPPGATADRVLAFDTGPGNMVIDAVMQELFGKSFDRGGKIAASGAVIEPVVERIVRQPFFRTRPPKTAGREEFGREFVREFLHACGQVRKQDIVATATALTAQTIGDSIERFVVGKIPTSSKIREKRGIHPRQAFREIILSGGGAKNGTLLQMISERLAPLGIRIRLSEEFGLPSSAKEAMAFAVLAYETWNRRPSNVPSATGARRPAVLGKISHA